MLDSCSSKRHRNQPLEINWWDVTAQALLSSKWRHISNRSTEESIDVLGEVGCSWWTCKLTFSSCSLKNVVSPKREVMNCGTRRPYPNHPVPERASGRWPRRGIPNMQPQLFRPPSLEKSCLILQPTWRGKLVQPMRNWCERCCIEITLSL